jgi:hypothetical protein
LDPGIFNADGSLNPSGAVSILFDRATVRTAITPDLVFPLSPSGEPPSRAMQELMNQLQPSVTLSGRFGNVEVSPYGQPVGQRSWLPLILLGGGALAFVGWALFGGKR